MDISFKIGKLLNLINLFLNFELINLFKKLNLIKSF